MQLLFFVFFVYVFFLRAYQFYHRFQNVNLQYQPIFPHLPPAIWSHLCWSWISFLWQVMNCVKTWRLFWLRCCIELRPVKASFAFKTMTGFSLHLSLYPGVVGAVSKETQNHWMSVTEGKDTQLKLTHQHSSDDNGELCTHRWTGKCVATRQVQLSCKQWEFRCDGRGE